MQLATILGHATATVKHPSLEGWKLIVAQPLLRDGSPDGDPQLAIDPIGGRRGDRVMLTSDGSGVRDLIGSNNTPVRWAVIGIIDDNSI